MNNNMNFEDLKTNTRELKVVVRQSYDDSMWSLDVSNNTMIVMEAPITTSHFYVEVIP